MICPIVATCIYAEDTTIDLATVFGENGQKNAYIGAPVEVAPVLDGQIGEGEYTYDRQIKPVDAGRTIPSDAEYTNVFTEYMAYDSDFIYYAYTGIFGNRSNSINIRANNDYVVGKDMSGFSNNIVINYGWSDATPNKRTDGSAPAGKASPVWDTDLFRATSTNVVELKISRAYLATQMGLNSGSEVTRFIYQVYLNWIYYNGASGLWGYVYNNNPISTEEAAALTTAGATTTPASILNVAILGEEPVEPELPAPTYAEINLEELYGANYVGKALSENSPKPKLDGVIGENEYQAKYVVAVDGAKDTARFGVPAVLLGDYTQYISHDDEWFYVAFDFLSGKSGNRGRLYWNLSFIDSYDVIYDGGATVNEAFTQNEHGLAEGWNFGIEPGDASTSANTAYSTRNNAVNFGAAPVDGRDFKVAVKNDLVSIPDSSAVTHQVIEIKVSKAWYAAQVGLESAADVRELAWVVLGDSINKYASSYTQIGHYISDADLATLNATGFTYTRPAVASHPYDSAMLPLLFVLDEEPVVFTDDEWKNTTHKLGLNLYIGAEMKVSPVVDGVVTPGEYSYTRTSPSGSAAEVQSDIVEYFAHDANYVYYAGVFEQKNNDRAFWVQWLPTNTFDIYHNNSDLNKYYYNRLSTQLRYKDDGSVTNNGFAWNNPNSRPTPTVGQTDDCEYMYAATKTASDLKSGANIKTYEIRIAKSYIASIAGCEVSEVKVIPYWTYFHATFNIGKAYGNDVANAIKATDPSAFCPADAVGYAFMVLEEAPNASSAFNPIDNIGVTTKDGASIRVSTTNPGLRFKTIVNTAELNALIAQYGEANVKVGTLIAPADVLGGAALTIDTATKVDVVATLDMPFEQNALKTTYAGSLTNIRPQNLTRDFTAVGYIAYRVSESADWIYIYAPASCTRNVTEIAQAALDAGEFAGNETAIGILKDLGAVAAE